MFNPIKKFNDFFNFIFKVLGKKIVTLLIVIMWFTLMLNMFFQDSISGVSLYVGFCFFVAVISFNKKAFKPKKTEKGS